MANTVVIGAQWGDEGKGKIVDMLGSKCQVIARFQGGPNAGHTIKAGTNEIILHLIPSGILHAGTQCLIGNGVVFDPWVFLEEVSALSQRGIDVSPKRLGLSKKAHLILPYHRELDRAREGCRSDKIGTTGRGIGPCYEDKAARTGLRAGDLANPQLVREKIGRALAEKNVLLQTLYGQKAMNASEISESILQIAPSILPYLRNVEDSIQEAMQKGESILFEGAQGIHLDVDHGTYPFVTSSNTVSGNASAGTGVSPTALGRILGIAKAYTTRVGSGPFPTELDDSTGQFMRKNGHEFGATTGRPRRCGWLDAVILRESVRLNGISGFALTKLDVLRGLPGLKICVAYLLDGKRLNYPPQEEGAMDRVTPIYEDLPGFDEDISGCKKLEDLPAAAKNYIRRIEELTGVPVDIISVGPEREETILLQDA